MRRIGLVVVTGLVMLTGCQVASSGSSAGREASLPHSSVIPSPTGSVIDETPKPNVRYTKSCDYELGNFEEDGSHGFRFIAQARLHNKGNVGTTVKVTASWVQVGQSPIKRTKTVHVKTGQSKSVNFLVPVGQDQIDNIQADTDYNSECHVKATMTGTFGKVS